MILARDTNRVKELNYTNFGPQIIQDLQSAFEAQSTVRVRRQKSSWRGSSPFRNSDGHSFILFDSGMGFDHVSGQKYTTRQMCEILGVATPRMTAAQRREYAELRQERERKKLRGWARHCLINEAADILIDNLRHIKDIDEYDREWHTAMTWFEANIDDKAIDQFIAREKARRESWDARWAEVDKVRDYSKTGKSAEVELEPFSTVRITYGLRTAMSTILTTQGAYFFFRLHAVAKGSFTIKEVSDLMGVAPKVARKHVKAAFYLREVGKEGKAVIYDWLPQRQVFEWIRDFGLQEAIFGQTRDQHNKQALQDNDPAYLLPEKARVECDGVTARNLKHKQEKRYAAALRMLDDRIEHTPNLTSQNDFVQDWILENVAASGLYVFELEERTGLERRTISYFLNKNGYRFEENETKATKQAIKQNGASKDMCKREALRKCQLQDKAIKAVKLVDKEEGCLIFQPIPARKIKKTQIVTLERTPNDKTELSAPAPAVKDESQSDKTGLFSDIPPEYALPSWPRWSMDLDDTRREAYDLWQLVVELAHAGEIEVRRHGNVRYLQAPAGKVRANLADLRDFDRGTYSFPVYEDGIIRLDDGEEIPF